MDNAALVVALPLLPGACVTIPILLHAAQVTSHCPDSHVRQAVDGAQLNAVAAQWGCSCIESVESHLALILRRTLPYDRIRNGTGVRTIYSLMYLSKVTSTSAATGGFDH